MLTKKDLTEIGKIVDKKIDSAFASMAKDVVELFNHTNETMESLINKLEARIDNLEDKIEKNSNETKEKLDSLLDHMKDHHMIAKNHERRIERIEEKIVTPKASS